jgi:hypothetical protein
MFPFYLSPFSNKSWSIASKHIFNVKEINQMEMEMFELLDFRIGEKGTKSLLEVLYGYQVQYDQWREAFSMGLISDELLDSSITQTSSSEPDIPTEDPPSSTIAISPARFSWISGTTISSGLASPTPSIASSYSSSYSDHSISLPPTPEPISSKPKKPSRSIWSHLRSNSIKSQTSSIVGN